MNLNNICRILKIKSMISTTIEQSKHLVELGLNTETADMSYYRDSYGNYMHKVETGKECDFTLTLDKYVPGDEWFDSVPAWSISAMFKQMPKGCDIRKHYGYDINDLRYVAGIWEYSEYEGFSEYTKYTTKFYDNPIDAAYDLLCWLIENDYIKTKKQ